MDNELHGSVNFISGKFIAPASCGAGAVSSQEAITLTSGWEKAPLPEMENKPEFLRTFALFLPETRIFMQVLLLFGVLPNNEQCFKCSAMQPDLQETTKHFPVARQRCCGGECKCRIRCH